MQGEQRAKAFVPRFQLAQAGSDEARVGHRAAVGPQQREGGRVEPAWLQTPRAVPAAAAGPQSEQRTGRQNSCVHAASRRFPLNFAAGFTTAAGSCGLHTPKSL